MPLAVAWTTNYRSLDKQLGRTLLRAAGLIVWTLKFVDAVVVKLGDQKLPALAGCRADSEVIWPNAARI
jgi:hypothetical protein